MLNAPPLGRKFGFGKDSLEVPVQVLHFGKTLKLNQVTPGTPLDAV